MHLQALQTSCQREIPIGIGHFFDFYHFDVRLVDYGHLPTKLESDGHRKKDISRDSVKTGAILSNVTGKCICKHCKPVDSEKFPLVKDFFQFYHVDVRLVDYDYLPTKLASDGHIKKDISI